MADKAISDLTQALQITNEDLFVLQQNGKAKKLKGATLLDFVTLNVVSVTVTTLPAGSSATATYDKSTGTLELGIPQGSKGDTGATGATGPANVLTIGSVTSGKVANATITGEAPNQVLNLVLEKGEQGEQGKQGIQGEIGPQGNPGADAPTITGITIRQSDYHLIVTLSDGTSYDAGYCRGQAGAGTGDMLASVYDPNNKHTDIFEYVNNAIKDVKVTTDATPTQGSANPVQSGGVYSALANKLDKPTNDATATAGQLLTKTIDGQKWADREKDTFVVNMTLSDGNSISSADKTFDEVQTAYNAGKTIMARLYISGAEVHYGLTSVVLYPDVAIAFTLSNGAISRGIIMTSEDISFQDLELQRRINVKGILKGDGAGGVSAAVPGSDYIASGNIVKQTLVNTETTPTENYAINWYFK